MNVMDKFVRKLGSKKEQANVQAKRVVKVATTVRAKVRAKEGSVVIVPTGTTKVAYCKIASLIDLEMNIRWNEYSQ